MFSFIKKMVIFVCILYTSITFGQGCYNENIITSAYATGGSGLYKNQILWLTWGGKSATNLYGTPNVNLTNGAKSYGSINLGAGKYLCIEAEIEKINSTAIQSYRPGDYSGDSKDDWYNIGGAGTNNKLISGIINRDNASTAYFRIKAKATINGTPIRLAGLVVADAESMASDEYIRAKADGIWRILEVKKNTSQGAYEIRKSAARKIIQFGGGNNQTTAALAGLKFNDTAYNGESFQISTEIVLKGGGKQAVAIGLLTPGMDLGDAPEYYGSPLHTLEKMDLTTDNCRDNITFNSDNLETGNWQGDNKDNINTNNYNAATFVTSINSYLGSQTAQPNSSNVHGPKANLDGFNTNEEDAWPSTYNNFSYKASFYNQGETLRIPIKYTSKNPAYITAWIDFNRNGKFGSNTTEQVTIQTNGNVSINNNTNKEFAVVKVDAATNGTAYLTWTIPQDRATRSTYVRIRIAEKLDEILSPISNAVNGEIEDHKINILAPTSSNPMLQNRAK